MSARKKLFLRIACRKRLRMHYPTGLVKNDGKKARDKYKKVNYYPLQDIRSYRNSLLHGRLLPGIINDTRFYLPKINKQNLYLDWRKITQLLLQREEYKKDFISVLTILESAWDNTIRFLENNWKNICEDDPNA